MSEVFNKTIEEERKYLEKVLKVLIEEINNFSQNIEDKKTTTDYFKRYIWQNRGELTDTEYNLHINEIDSTTNRINEEIKRLSIYKKALNSPYFGRIDFLDEDEVIPIYIGLTNLKKGINNYVFDWRAPVSSLFYNYSVGPAKYKAPIGEIEGEIQLRRQYKIVKGILERMIESDIKIDDEILQEVLANSSTDKMKNIVMTIQREQNEIIRNNSFKHLIVQGVAGSGKTSVALHRIAYLLYQRKDLSSNNILIFSPNDVFSDYISDVLPELGEQNVLKTTFAELASNYIKNKNFQEFTSFIDEYYNNNNNPFKYIINKFKLSDSYKECIDKFLEEYLYLHILKKDLTIKLGDEKKAYINASTFNDLFLTTYKKLPISNRIDTIIDRICNDNNISYKKYYSLIKNKLLEHLNIELDSNKIYQDFLNSESFINSFDFDPRTFNSINDIISYEDLIGVLYLEFEINGYPTNPGIKCVVIDEAQDYSKLQLYILKRIFTHASFTILGDINQTINPYYRYDDFASLKDLFGSETEYYELNKSYRSSPEIIDYASKVLDISNQSSIRLSNNLPIKYKEETKNLSNELINDIKSMKERGLKRIAIVTKNMGEANQLLKLLTPYIKVSLATDSLSNDNIIIAPTYIAKGLEFDGVILYTSPDNIYTESEKYLYYVACTRAQHELIIYNQPKLEKRKECTYQLKKDAK